jgi:hypothetical protein
MAGEEDGDESAFSGLFMVLSFSNMVVHGFVNAATVPDSTSPQRGGKRGYTANILPAREVLERFAAKDGR